MLPEGPTMNVWKRINVDCSGISAFMDVLLNGRLYIAEAAGTSLETLMTSSSLLAIFIGLFSTVIAPSFD
jgi:hypothetical protein